MLTELPFDCTAHDYAVAAEWLAEHWARGSTAPVSVLQIGEVKAPGVSDLDFILVFEDGPGVLPFASLDPDHYSSEIRMYYTHSAYVCTVSTYAHLRVCLPVFQVRPLRGAVPSIIKIDESEKPGIAAANLVNYLSIKMPADILRISSRPLLRVRTLLCMLNSIKYVAHMAGEAGIPLRCAAQGDILGQEVQELRTSWKNITITKSGLQELTRRCVDFLGIVTAEVAEYIEKRCGYGDVSSTRSIRNAHCKLVPGWEFPDAVARARKEVHAGREFLWEVPAAFQETFSHLAWSNRAFAQFLRHHGYRQSGVCAVPEWRAGLDRFAASAVAYQTVLAKRGYHATKYVGFGYEKPAAFTRRLMRWARRQGARVFPSS